MDLIIVIILWLLLLIIAFLIQGGIFYVSEKLFRIANANYKNSLKVTFFLAVTQIVLIFLLWVINFFSSVDSFGSKFMVVAVFFSIFFSISFLCVYYFLKKYYRITWKKSLGILFVYSLISVLISYPAEIFIKKPILTHVVRPFYVEGSTMSPTLNSHDYVLIKKWEKQYARGDIIVFRYSKEPIYSMKTGTILIKRIIGLPMEKIEIRNGIILVNNNILEEPYIKVQTPGIASLVLNKDEYFVLGDNRGKSLDSRFYGPISFTDIQGKVFLTVHSSQWNFLKNGINGVLD